MSHAEAGAGEERHYNTSSSDYLGDEGGDSRGLGGAQDFPIKSAPTMSPAAFAAVLARHQSPATGDAEPLYDTCVQFGVNPAVALAFFAKESTFGTDPNRLALQTRNWGNLIKATNPARTTGQTVRFFFQSGNKQSFHDFPVYKSWVDGLSDFCDRLTSPHGPYAPFNLTTLSTVIPVFAPSSDGNDPGGYLQLTLRLINAWADEAAASPPSNPPVLGPASGQAAQVVAYVQPRLPAGSEYTGDVGTIVGYYWQYAPGVGIDPFVAAAQCVLETDALTAYWAGRPRRNPANLGVPDPNDHQTGLSFPSWDVAVQAHLGHLLAFALRDDQANAAQQALLARDPLHDQVPAALRGTVATVQDLAGRWRPDPAYGATLIALIGQIRQGTPG